MMVPLSTVDLLNQVAAALPEEPPVYLVGGAVRDLLLGRPMHDLDFVMGGDVLRLARLAADALHGAYFPLDEARATGRVILFQEDGARQVLDFAAMRGPDLESDLRGRDFTINAMALRLQRQVEAGDEDMEDPARLAPGIGALVDPLGGAADLRSKVLRACSPDAFEDDPLRVLRAVRLANAFRLRIEPETLRRLKAAIPGLERVSSERIREEVLRMLEGPQAANGLRLLDAVGVLQAVLPELAAMKGESQSAPHNQDVWNHTLEVIQRLESVLAVLTGPYQESLAATMALGEVSLRLGRYREKITQHLAERLLPDRTVRALLFLAALYHDSGKPSTRSVDEQGQIRFFDHDKAGAELAAARAQALHMSRVEIERLRAVVRHHMRPLLLTLTGDVPSRRAVYRFFRDTGPAGVDICFLSLADMLGTYGAELPQETWAQHVQTVRVLLEAWWERAEEAVAPPPLVSGTDLMERLRLKPGPQVGRLLERLREAQAEGNVRSQEQAYEFLQHVLDNEKE